MAREPNKTLKAINGVGIGLILLGLSVMILGCLLSMCFLGLFLV